MLQYVRLSSDLRGDTCTTVALRRRVMTRVASIEKSRAQLHAAATEVEDEIDKQDYGMFMDIAEELLQGTMPEREWEMAMGALSGTLLRSDFVSMDATALEHGPANNGAGPHTPFAEVGTLQLHQQLQQATVSKEVVMRHGSWAYEDVVARYLNVAAEVSYSDHVAMHATALEHGPANNGAGPQTPFAESEDEEDIIESQLSLPEEEKEELAMEWSRLATGASSPEAEQLRSALMVTKADQLAEERDNEPVPVLGGHWESEDEAGIFESQQSLPEEENEAVAVEWSRLSAGASSPEAEQLRSALVVTKANQTATKRIVLQAGSETRIPNNSQPLDRVGGG